MPPRFPHHFPENVDVVEESLTGSCPVPFTPTHATLMVQHDVEGTRPVYWNSRSHRKQRYHHVHHGHSRHVNNPFLKIIRIAKIEYWNVSWWVGLSFTAGSIVWVVNGFQAFLPFVTSVQKDPSGTGWSAFVGATIFFFGSVLLIVEAWNRDDAALFGYALKHSLKHLENGHNTSPKNESPEELAKDEQLAKWVWFSTDTKYFREIGFVAGFVQWMAATIFWISGFAGIAQINEALMPHTGRLDGVFWTPQVIGGSGFIISSALYMLEAQKKWYLPAPFSLGWHSGFWNLIGGIGFTACGAFGYSTRHWAQYQSTLSTFWGGWAFLIGSLIQWYEAVNPVDPGENKDINENTTNTSTPTKFTEANRTNMTNTR